ncbi:hypothetical protein VIGAN_08299900 [Vigna angularis var. angularis]|uniref:Uncharacterized protein n=1 Tax=Vigna angularis var. angularis TaxID=157739 RepID=A0A0S3STF9_PHAAN|nr:hypothetical protein VIGAN_08299900 [Vigna angularis var. angularis]
MIANIYQPSQGICVHVDLLRFDDGIAILSLEDLLYTGSESKNIRVWKHLKDYTDFKSSSGLVKTIIIAVGKIFTGHQDGKIRVWKVSSKNRSKHKRIGSLPTFKDYMKCSMKPKNYVEVRRNQNRNAVMVGEMKVIVGVNQRGLEMGL